MRTFLAALLVALAFGCSHAKESTSADAQPAAERSGQAQATLSSSLQPGQAMPAALDAGQPSAAGPSGGPETAAEAAAQYAAQPASAQPSSSPQTMAQAAPASAEDLSCTSDDECGFTRVGPADCCPMLCSPRVVTKKLAAALEARIATCHPGQCPVPSCMPPQKRTAPSCQAGKCTAKVLGPMREAQ